MLFPDLILIAECLLKYSNTYGIFTRTTVCKRSRYSVPKVLMSSVRMQWSWGLACIPLIPLLATPVPNLPLYYAGYKVS